MTAVLVHLSDIHIKSSSDPIIARAKDIAASTFSVLPDASHVFIVISGDIAFSGQLAEYQVAEQFLKNVRDAINSESPVPVSFVIAPGNHDCNFRENTIARKTLVNQLCAQELPEVDDSVIDSCTIVQTAFFKFRNSLEEPAKQDDKLWRSHRFTVDNKSLSIDCLNVSWVSRNPEEPARLYFPFNRYINRPETDDFKLIIMHQPLNWFSQNVYRGFRTFIRKLADIVLTGHEHQGNLGINDDVETGKSVYVEGCVLQDHSQLSKSAFNIILLDVVLKRFSSTCLEWNGTRYEPNEKGSWSNYRELPRKSPTRFEIDPTFAEFLDDPGAYLTRSGRPQTTLA